MFPNRKSRFIGGISVLEQFKLLTRRIDINNLFPIKQLNISKLFICYAHDSDLSILRQKRFNSFYMYGCILATGTMTDINGKLKHRKTITLQILPEIRIRFLVFLCFSRQIKLDKYPHNTIFTKTIHHISGYEILRNSPLKHLYKEAVVCPTATISGLRFPEITTSKVGIVNNFPFNSLVNT